MVNGFFFDDVSHRLVDCLVCVWCGVCLCVCEHSLYHVQWNDVAGCKGRIGTLILAPPLSLDGGATVYVVE